MSSIVVAGDTSGSVTISAPAVAGTTTLTLPTTNGTILTSASGQSLVSPAITGTPTISGVNFGPYSMKNRIINGAMVIDQRNAGASLAIPDSTGTYTLDRWRAYESTDGSLSVQRSSTAPTAGPASRSRAKCPTTARPRRCAPSSRRPRASRCRCVPRRRRSARAGRAWTRRRARSRGRSRPRGGAGGPAPRPSTRRSPDRGGARPPTARGLELRGRRQEGHLVVGLAQPHGERAHERPEHVVGEVLVHEQQVLERGLGDQEQAAADQDEVAPRGVGLQGRSVPGPELVERRQPRVTAARDVEGTEVQREAEQVVAHRIGHELDVSEEELLRLGAYLNSLLDPTEPTDLTNAIFGDLT